MDDQFAELISLSENNGRLVRIRPQSLALELPEPHRRMLDVVNGFTVYHGAFRMFGSTGDPWSDIDLWNQADTWRYAWNSRADGFLFFGGTAWGDQYAYGVDEDGHRVSEEIHFLEGTSLRPEVIADSFSTFLRDELMRNATTPYDTMTVHAVQQGGPVAFEDHWSYVPPLQLGGDETTSTIVTLRAVTAMTFAGDLMTALDDASPELSVSGVEVWTDEFGRARLKALFAE